MLRQAIEDPVLCRPGNVPTLARATAPAPSAACRHRRRGFRRPERGDGPAQGRVDVTVIDRRNYHLFQPLLYQVATAGLSPAQIATPIRRILARRRTRRCSWKASRASTSKRVW